MCEGRLQLMDVCGLYDRVCRVWYGVYKIVSDVGGQPRVGCMGWVHGVGGYNMC